MSLSDWPFSSNPFGDPMSKTIKHGIEISIAHEAICFARKGLGATELIMYNNYKTQNDALLVLAGIRTGEITAMPVYTEVKVNYYVQMAGKLEHFKIIVSPLYDSTTTEFKLIFGLNLDRFYHGTYAEIANAIEAMAVTMDAYVSLNAAAVEVRAYHTQLIDSGSDQHTEFDDAAMSSVNIKKQLMTCAGVMDQNLGYAKVLNATIADETVRRANIDSWFPLDLIRKGPATGFTEAVKSLMTVYLGTKTFKTGEKVKITVVGASLNIGTSYDRKHAAIKFVTFNDGVPVTVDPFSGVWDLTQHNWVATNLDAGAASHVVFEFVKPV